MVARSEYSGGRLPRRFPLKRDRRVAHALRSDFEIVSENGTGDFIVRGTQGKNYEVRLFSDRLCTCLDNEQEDKDGRFPRCKHVLHVLIQHLSYGSNDAVLRRRWTRAIRLAILKQCKRVTQPHHGYLCKEEGCFKVARTRQRGVCREHDFHLCLACGAVGYKKRNGEWLCRRHSLEVTSPNASLPSSETPNAQCCSAGPTDARGSSHDPLSPAEPLDARCSPIGRTSARRPPDKPLPPVGSSAAPCSHAEPTNAPRASEDPPPSVGTADATCSPVGRRNSPMASEEAPPSVEPPGAPCPRVGPRNAPGAMAQERNAAETFPEQPNAVGAFVQERNVPHGHAELRETNVGSQAQTCEDSDTGSRTLYTTPASLRSTYRCPWRSTHRPATRRTVFAWNARKEVESEKKKERSSWSRLDFMLTYLARGGQQRDPDDARAEVRRSALTQTTDHDCGPICAHAAMTVVKERNKSSADVPQSVNEVRKLMSAMWRTEPPVNLSPFFLPQEDVALGNTRNAPEPRTSVRRLSPATFVREQHFLRRDAQGAERGVPASFPVGAARQVGRKGFPAERRRNALLVPTRPCWVDAASKDRRPEKTVELEPRMTRAEGGGFVQWTRAIRLAILKQCKRVTQSQDVVHWAQCAFCAAWRKVSAGRFKTAQWSSAVFSCKDARLACILPQFLCGVSKVLAERVDVTKRSTVPVKQTGATDNVVVYGNAKGYFVLREPDGMLRKVQLWNASASKKTCRLPASVCSCKHFKYGAPCQHVAQVLDKELKIRASSTMFSRRWSAIDIHELEIACRHRTSRNNSQQTRTADDTRRREAWREAIWRCMDDALGDSPRWTRRHPRGLEAERQEGNLQPDVVLPRAKSSAVPSRRLSNGIEADAYSSNAQEPSAGQPNAQEHNAHLPSALEPQAEPPNVLATSSLKRSEDLMQVPGSKRRRARGLPAAAPSAKRVCVGQDQAGGEWQNCTGGCVSFSCVSNASIAEFSSPTEFQVSEWMRRHGLLGKCVGREGPACKGCCKRMTIGSRAPSEKTRRMRYPIWRCMTTKCAKRTRLTPAGHLLKRRPKVGWKTLLTYASMYLCGIATKTCQQECKVGSKCATKFNQIVDKVAAASQREIGASSLRSVALCVADETMVQRKRKGDWLCTASSVSRATGKTDRIFAHVATQRDCASLTRNARWLAAPYADVWTDEHKAYRALRQERPDAWTSAVNHSKEWATDGGCHINHAESTHAVLKRLGKRMRYNLKHGRISGAKLEDRLLCLVWIRNMALQKKPLLPEWLSAVRRIERASCEDKTLRARQRHLEEGQQRS